MPIYIVMEGLNAIGVGWGVMDGLGDTPYRLL